MRTEHKSNALLAAAYRKLRPSADVFKVNDRVARSRPDLQITDLGQTWFIEAKRDGNTLTPGQVHELGRLRVASARRTIVAFYTKDNAVRLAYDAPTGPAVRLCGSIVEAARFLESLIASRA